jgi:GR25 family glycosyltransferase involved in LPS biosynthesis
MGATDNMTPHAGFSGGAGAEGAATDNMIPHAGFSAGAGADGGAPVVLVVGDPARLAADQAWLQRLLSGLPAERIRVTNQFDVWPDVLVVYGEDGPWTQPLNRHAQMLSQATLCVWIDAGDRAKGKVPPPGIAYHIRLLIAPEAPPEVMPTPEVPAAPEVPVAADGDAEIGAMQDKLAGLMAAQTRLKAAMFVTSAGGALTVPRWYRDFESCLDRRELTDAFVQKMLASSSLTREQRATWEGVSGAALTERARQIMAQNLKPVEQALATAWARLSTEKQIRQVLERARLLRVLGHPEHAIAALSKSGLLKHLTFGEVTCGQGGSDAADALPSSGPELAALGLAFDCWLETGGTERRREAWGTIRRLIRSRAASIVGDPAWLTRFAAAFEICGGEVHARMPMKIVNLDRRPDRWLNFQRQAEQYKQLDVQRWPAVDGLELKRRGPETLSAHFRVPPPPADAKNAAAAPRQLPWGAIGCFESHIAIWRALAASPSKSADSDLALSDWWFAGEDDGVLGPMFVRDWAMLAALGPDLAGEYDVIWLGWLQQPHVRWQSVMNCAPRRFMHSAQNETQRMIGGTHGYLISRRGAKKLLELFEQEKTPITVGVDSWMFRGPARQLTIDPPTVLAQYFLPNDPASQDSDCAA